MKEKLKRYKEVFRMISIGGVIPIVVSNCLLKMVWLGMFFLLIQLTCFIIMWIIGWEHE